FKNTVGYG
ncbi:hypothetical protein D021_4853B, partial [Vibrio parahaemolyticus 10296]